jgi:hypothetical protein
MIDQSLRVVFALFAAAAVSATIFVAVDVTPLLLSPAEADSISFVLETIVLLWPLAFGVALIHAVALGLPAYLVLSRRGLTAWWIALIGGFAVGSLPYAILALPWSSPPPDLVQAHVIAPFAWTHYLAAILGLGGLGMAGGIAAWIVRYRLGNRPVPTVE